MFGGVEGPVEQFFPEFVGVGQAEILPPFHPAALTVEGTVFLQQSSLLGGATDEGSALEAVPDVVNLLETSPHQGVGRGGATPAAAADHQQRVALPEPMGHVLDEMGVFVGTALEKEVGYVVGHGGMTDQLILLRAAHVQQIHPLTPGHQPMVGFQCVDVPGQLCVPGRLDGGGQQQHQYSYPVSS